MGVAYHAALKADVAGVSTTARGVLLYLVLRANSRAQCWPKQDTIAAFMGVKRNAIAGAIRELKEAKLLTSQRTGRYCVYTVRCICTGTSDVASEIHPKNGSGKISNLLLDTSYLISDGGASAKGQIEPGEGELKYQPKSTKKVSEIKIEMDLKPKTIGQLLQRTKGKPVVLKTVEQFWRYGVRLEYDDQLIASFTGKQYGYAKRIIAEFKKETFRQLAWAIENWPAYVKQSNKMTGEKSKPNRPNLGYVSAHLSELQSLSAED